MNTAAAAGGHRRPPYPSLPLWLCGGAFCLFGAAAFAQQACEVVAVSGEARQADGKPLAVGDKLDVGATLRTGAAGRVRLRFVDGSVLVLADKSQLRIEAFDAGAARPRQAELMLELGLISQRVSPSAGGSWKVRTPTAVTAVRGTEFSVDVGDDHATTVLVTSGAVDVEPTGPQTRGIQPRYPVRLAKGLGATRCDARACSEAAPLTPERAQRVEQRLGSLD